MLGNILPPYHSLQELNLDWILTKVKNMLRFLPDDGAVGQILRRTAHGAEWSDEQGAGGSVTSVNGMQGAVVLTKSDIGLGSVDDVQQYSASNPPPYPVTSVNAQTGAVTLAIPTDTADLTNTAGFVDAAGAAAAAPVQSVNGQTGAVVIPTGSAGWGTPTNVTLPFTPTADGFVVGLFAPSTSANSWMFVSDNSSPYMRAMSSGGTGYGMSFPAVNGHSYTIQSSGNIGSSTWTFIPFA